MAHGKLPLTIAITGECAHTQPRVIQVPRPSLRSPEVHPREKCRQPVSWAQASPASGTLAEVFGLWPREEKLYTEQPFGSAVLLEASFQRRFRRDKSCSPLLVVHNSKWQLMGESLSNYSCLRTHITEISLGNQLGESLSSYSWLRAYMSRVSLGNLPGMIFSWHIPSSKHTLSRGLQKGVAAEPITEEGSQNDGHCTQKGPSKL